MIFFCIQIFQWVNCFLRYLSDQREVHPIDPSPKAPLNRLLSKFLRARRVREYDFHFVTVREARTGSAAKSGKGTVG